MDRPSFIGTFTAPSMPATYRQSPTCSLPSPTRRQALQLISSLAVSAATLLYPNLPSLGEEKPSLPGGAAQFSRLISGQKQWDSLANTLNTPTQLEDKEWDSLRGYLRTVYSLSGDMDYLTKVWSKELQTQGQTVIKHFRATLREMDKPALAKDKQGFANLHTQVSEDFVGFFDLLRKASVADIPDEL